MQSAAIGTFNVHQSKIMSTRRFLVRLSGSKEKTVGTYFVEPFPKRTILIGVLMYIRLMIII